MGPVWATWPSAARGASVRFKALFATLFAVCDYRFFSLHINVDKDFAAECDYLDYLGGWIVRKKPYRLECDMPDVFSFEKHLLRADEFELTAGFPGVGGFGDGDRNGLVQIGCLKLRRVLRWDYISSGATSSYPRNLQRKDS